MALEPTPGQTVGPYLALGLEWEDGPVADPLGVRVGGRVLDGAGAAIPDALVETWDPASRSFARSLTGDDGGWHVVTPPAPHLEVNVFARGLLHRLVTRAYLDPRSDDLLLQRVPEDRRATLIAAPDHDGFRLDIRIQGPGETVFLDV